jgi:hypothetical protein
MKTMSQLYVIAISSLIKVAQLELQVQEWRAGRKTSLRDLTFLRGLPANEASLCQ